MPDPVLDGLFAEGGHGSIRFHQATHFSVDDARDLQPLLQRRVLRVFQRRGLLDDHTGPEGAPFRLRRMGRREHLLGRHLPSWEPMERSPVRQLLAELKRRRVYRVAAVYVVVAWILLQLGNIVVEPLRLPEWTMAFLIVLLVVGFPVAMVLAWAFDITPEGVRRTEPLRPKHPEGVAATGSQKARNAALIGLGALIAVLAIGTFAFFQGPPAGPDGREGEGFQSVAVLPFANTSPDAENEFFADGVTEDILTHLALVDDFAVPSRTTIMRYKGSSLSVPEIATELGVRYVLEGSVRRAGDQVRITAQLVDGRTDQRMWAETYDRRLEDIFAVQTEIATSITAALEAELSRGVASRIERPPTEDLEAYDLFLRGREQYYLYSPQGTEQAIDLFRGALERDPAFALARAWLARAFAINAFNHGAGAHWGDSAVTEARRAAAEEPQLAVAHTALGTALAVTGRYAEAEPALERGTELNPNDWAAISNLGLVYAERGRRDEAIRLTRRSLEREPARTHIAHTNLAFYYEQLGLYESARESVTRALELQPDYPGAIFQTGWLDLLEGRTDRARATAARLAEAGRENLPAALLAGTLHVMDRDAERAAAILAAVQEASPTAETHQSVGVMYGWALLELGRAQEAAEVFAEAEAHAREQIAAGSERPVARYSLAGIHALRRETDEAFRWLDEAVSLGWNLSHVLARDPTVDGLRDDPRFQEIAHRVEARQRELRDRVAREGL